MDESEILEICHTTIWVYIHFFMYKGEYKYRIKTGFVKQLDSFYRILHLSLCIVKESYGKG